MPNSKNKPCSRHRKANVDKTSALSNRKWLMGYDLYAVLVMNVGGNRAQTYNRCEPAGLEQGILNFILVKAYSM